MELQDIVFTPHNDAGADEIGIINKHNNLIKQENFSDATALLDNNDFSKGFRASLFKSIEKKIQNVQVYLLNKTAEPDELYSIDEPTEIQMEGKTFWIQPYEI